MCVLLQEDKSGQLTVDHLQPLLLHGMLPRAAEGSPERQVLDPSQVLQSRHRPVICGAVPLAKGLPKFQQLPHPEHLHEQDAVVVSRVWSSLVQLLSTVSRRRLTPYCTYFLSLQQLLR